MGHSGIWKRIKNGGYEQVIVAYDWPSAIIITLGVFYVFRWSITNYELDVFISEATTLSGSLIAIILTGVAILVSVADEQFLSLLHKEDIYDPLMSSFETTALLSILVTVLGIIIQTIGTSAIAFYLFLFVFLYLLFAIIALISNIISFGDRMGKMASVQNLPEDLGEKIEIVHEDELPDDEENDPETESDIN
jgi:hypothetical protein